MSPFEIQCELKKRGFTQKQIAIEEGVSEMTISGVIYKTKISNRIMRAIACRIERDHREVFPEYYFAAPRRTTSKVA